MKRNLLLLSASAAVCLAWPLAGLAEPRSDPAASSERQDQQPHKQAGGEGAHQANEHQRAAPSAAMSRPAHVAGETAPPHARNAAPDFPAQHHSSQGREIHAQAPATYRQPGERSQRLTEGAQAPSAAPARRSTEVMGLRRNVQASQHFHAAAYRAPEGYARRHWGYGERLPSAYFARNYWIMDYSLYALLAPPEGLVWVRVGDDVMLIDRYTGEIIQVDYGYFE